ncbi:MAG: hypothetical protein ACE5G1_09060 [bacterium]
MSARLARMHTAEHILSAVMRKYYQAPRNLEFHLNEKKTKCDYDVPASLSDRDIVQIERLVNDEILKNHPVTNFFLNRRDASDYDLWKVPSDSDTIRIVKIGEFDAQPCRGEHVNHTQEIGHFKINSYELRENSRVRIRFKVE